MYGGVGLEIGVAVFFPQTCDCTFLTPPRLVKPWLSVPSWRDETRQAKQGPNMFPSLAVLVDAETSIRMQPPGTNRLGYFRLKFKSQKHWLTKEGHNVFTFLFCFSTMLDALPKLTVDFVSVCLPPLYSKKQQFNT